jgi:hypothetical protein
MKKVNTNNLRQGQTVYMVYLDMEANEWLMGQYRLYSDKTPLPEQGNMIECMPRSHFRDSVMRFMPPNRVFHSRRKALRRCNMMNGVK